jgi:hypothetical protein
MIVTRTFSDINKSILLSFTWAIICLEKWRASCRQAKQPKKQANVMTHQKQLISISKTKEMSNSIIQWVNRISQKTRLVPELATSTTVASAFKVCDGMFSNAFHILATGNEQGTPQSRKTMEDAIPSEFVGTMHDAIWILFDEFGSVLGHHQFIHVLDFPNVIRCRQFIVHLLKDYDWSGHRRRGLNAVYFHQNNGFYVNKLDRLFELDKNGAIMKGMICTALHTSVLYSTSHLFQKYFDDLLIASVQSEEWKLIGFNLMHYTLIGRDLTLDGQADEGIHARMDGDWIDSWESF